MSESHTCGLYLARLRVEVEGKVLFSLGQALRLLLDLEV